MQRDKVRYKSEN